MKVREIMTTEVATAQPDSTLEEVASMMKEEDTGAIPVLDEDQLVGIITDRDISIKVVAAGSNPQQTLVGDHMTADPVTGTPEMSDRAALDLMGQHKIRRLPVVENGRLVGVVSLGDFALEADRDREVEDALEEISEPVR